MKTYYAIGWILWKDLVSERRSREMVSSMFFFAAITLLIFSFSLSMDRPTAQALMPGLIWVAFGFTGVIGLGKSFMAELHNDCLENLQISPIPFSTDSITAAATTEPICPPVLAPAPCIRRRVRRELDACVVICHDI